MTTKSITTTKKQAPAKVQQEETPPLNLIELAIKSNADIDKLEKLMNMQKEWEARQAYKAYLDAKSLFISLCPVIKKNKSTYVKTDKGGYGYKWADTGNIHNQIKNALFQCRLSYSHKMMEKENGKIEVTCVLSHGDGHSESFPMEAGLDNSGAKNLIQQKASTITYLERYTLLGALGISTADEDNDGKTHSQPKQEDRSEEDVLADWQAAVDGCATVAALTVLFNKNRKTIEPMPKVKEMFSLRKVVIEANTPVTEKPVMP